MRNLICSAALFAACAYAATIGSGTLVDAAKNHDREAVKALVKQHADVNATEPDGTTALHWAAHWNDLELVDLLLSAGANPAALNRYGVVPLAEAAANTQVTAAGETVLMRAARVGNLEAVKVLLDHGADPNVKENFRGQTVLMWAAAEGHPDVIKALITKGAELNVRSFDRDTKLPNMEAGTPNAPIARGGLTVLTFAARQGQLEAAQALIDGGADLNQKDSDGNNALVLAILNTHYDLAQMLIDRGADPNVAANNGRTALYTAVEMHDVDWSPRPAHKETDQHTSMDIIRSLLDRGANVNAQLKDHAAIQKAAQDMGDKTLAAGATPFMRAARSADIEVMKMLLAKGADPKLANKDGLTALMLAAGNGWVEHIKGSEAEALEAVKLCDELGLDVNAATEKGDTALHGAAHRGADSIVKFLANQGAKVDARNKRGFTALDIALGKGGPPGATGTPHETTAALIKQLGGTPGEELMEPPKVTAQEGKPAPKPSPSSVFPRLLLLCSVAPVLVSADLPDGPGKDILLRACTNCHKAEEFPAYRHTKEEYQAIVYRMGERGARASTQELDTVAAYPAKNFPKADDTSKVNINKASAKEIETGLGLTAREAEAIAKYREGHGDFRVWGDLLVIYGVDGRKIEAAKDRIGF